MYQKKYANALTLFVVLSLVGFATIACSKGGNSQGPQGGPPPEAIKACEGKNAGDSATFKGRQGETLTAVCKDIQGQLAAVPEGGPR